jgi:hypothetical protein
MTAEDPYTIGTDLMVCHDDDDGDDNDNYDDDDDDDDERKFSGICLKELRTSKTSQNSRTSGQELIPGRPDTKSERYGLDVWRLS